VSEGRATADWALVTGACSGIGLAIAHQLAARGHPLVVVSHRAQALEEAARALAAQHQVQVEPLCVDLARESAAAELIAHVERLGIEPMVVVNNAGVFFFGEVADADPAKVAGLLQLHVVTPSLLSRHFARAMRARRRGHLLFVSSISAWNDFPGIALYGASKRYLKSFGLALRAELAVWGVNVTVVAPGATATGLYESTVVDVQKARRFGVMAGPEFVARAAVQAMFAGRALSVPGVTAKLFAWAMWLAPRWAIVRLRRWAPWLPRP